MAKYLSEAVSTRVVVDFFQIRSWFLNVCQINVNWYSEDTLIIWMTLSDAISILEKIQITAEYHVIANRLRTGVTSWTSENIQNIKGVTGLSPML